MRRSIQCSPSASPRSVRPRPRRASRPSPRASLPEQRQLALEPRRQVRPQPGMRLELEGMGRLVQRDPGPERTDGHAAGWPRWRGCSPRRTGAVRRLLGREQREVVLAQDARAHEPEQVAELARGHPAVGERHRRLGQAAAGRDDLVEQVRLELPDERREGRRVGAHPAGPVDDAGALDDARQLRAERLVESAGTIRGHRLGVGGFGGAQLGRGQRARAPCASRAMAIRSTAGQSTRPAARGPLRVAADDGRRGAERRPDEEAGLPDAVVAPGRAARCRPVAHRAATARSIDATSGNASPNMRTAIARNRPDVAGRELAMRDLARGGRLEPVDRQQLGERRRRRRRGVDDRHAARRATAAMSGAAAGSGCSRGAACRRAPAGRGKINSPSASRSPSSGASASATAASATGPLELARLDERHERGRGVLVDLDRRVLVLDRGEVGVRADRRRRRDDPDAPVARGEGGRRGPGPDDPEDRQVVAAAEVARARRPSRCCRRPRGP